MLTGELGGWYLNGSTLEYRLFKEDGVTLSTNVLAKITGLNVKGSGTDIQVKNSDGAWVDLTEDNASSYISINDVQDSETKKCTGTIELKDLILGQKDVVLTNNSPTGYKGAFTIGIPDENKVQIAKAGDKSSEYLSYDSKNGKILVKADLTAGFTVNSTTKATYKNASPDTTLATISGLRKLATSATTEAIKAYEDSADLTDTALDTTFDKAGVVTLSKVDVGGESTDTTSEGSVLGTTSISIAASDVAKANGISYTLDLNQLKEGKYGYAQAGLDKYQAEAYWTYSGTTASYKIDSPTGYELTDNNNATVFSGATKIKVTASKSTTVVTVNGLAKDLDISKDKKSIGTYTFTAAGEAKFNPGLTIGGTTNVPDSNPSYEGTTLTEKGEVTVNINKNVITNTNVSLSTNNLYTPKFEVNVDNILTEEKIEDIWVVDGSTAYLRRVRRAWYKPDKADGTATKLTYAGQTTLYTFLTITGLSAEALDAAEKTYESDQYEPAVITAIDGLKVDGDLDTLVNVVENSTTGLHTYTKKTDATDLTININTDLLDNTTAKIGNSDKFKITLTNTDDSAPIFDKMQWNVESNGTKAILKGDITEGYVVKADGKSVTYTKSGKNQTLATITGLKKGTKLVVDGDTRKIGFGNGDSFKEGITFAENDNLDSNFAVDYSTASDAKEYKRKSIVVSKNVVDTSKVQINSSFFDLELAGDGAVGGAVPTDSISGNYWTLGTTATYKNNFGPYYELANNQLSITYKNPANNTNKPTVLTTVKGLNANVTVEDLVVDNDTIKVNPNALDNKNVTITNPTLQSATQYKLALSQDIKPTVGSAVWGQTGEKVTYVASVEGGYRANNDGTAIIYTPSKEEINLFTITGVRTSLGGDSTGFAGVSLKPENNEVKLYYSALNNKNVTLNSSYGYDLVVDEGIPTVAPGSTPTESLSTWAIEGTTATYKAVVPAYYEYNADKETLTYKKATDKKLNQVKITGLKSGLFVSESGSGTGIGYFNETGTFVEAISIDTEHKQITVKDKGALSTSALKIDGAYANSGYSIALAESLEEEIKPKFNSDTPNSTWTVKGTTAYLLGGVSAGWVTSEDKKSILYYAGKDTAATIATIKNLPSGVTTAKANGANGLSVADHAIKVGTDMLGTTKLALTTNIPINDANYYFALDESSNVNTYTKAVNDMEKVWTIKNSTATYRGSIASAYYDVLGSASDTISYNAAGLPDDLQLAKLEGLASDLVTVQGGAVKGIDVSDDTNPAITMKLHANVLKAGSSVTLTDLRDDNFTFSLAIDEDVPTPKAAEGFKRAGTNLALFKGTTSGYSLAGESQLDYVPVKTSGNDNDELAVITGLTTNFKSLGITVPENSPEVYDVIDGIEVNSEKVITLSNNVLTGNSDVEFTKNEDNAYSFALGDDVTPYSAGLGWRKMSDGTYILYDDTSKGGYSVAADELSVKNLAGGSSGTTQIGTISGLKNNLTVDANYQIAGISFDEATNTIYLSQNVLNGKDVELLKSNGQLGGYTLALNKDEEDEAAYVAGKEITNLWSFTNGTATYEEKTTAGYDVDITNDKKIIYTKAQSIVTKIDNLSKENIKVSENGAKLLFSSETSGANGDEPGNVPQGQTEPESNEVEAITFDSTLKTFKINEADALAHKNTSIKVTYTGLTDAEKADHKYTLDVADSIKATVLDPTWTKTNKETTATLKQTTKAGYRLALDGSKITYSSDPTEATLATIKNLKRDVALNGNGKIDDETDTIAGLSYANIPTSSASASGTITVSKGVLDTLTVSLGKDDKFEFAFDTATDTKVPTTAAPGQAWVVNANKTSAIYKSGTAAYYDNKKNDTATEDKKQIFYHAASLTSDLATLNGLKSGVKANADGTIGGISFNGNIINLSGEALGNSNVSLSGTGYALGLSDDGSVINHSNSSAWENQTEWISSGSTYTYKTYNKTNYDVSAVDSPTKGAIVYYPETAGTEHAKVTGLQSGLTFDNSSVFTKKEVNGSIVGGTLNLTEHELNKAKVTVTNKDIFKLELGLADESLKASVTPNESWATSGTKATLGGTIGVGYTVSENKDTITYNKTKKTQTLATVTGLKSGAKIDADTDVKTITLNANQLSTTDVKVTGDGYTLALDPDDQTLESKFDAPKWIKAAGNNKATFTQTTYNGFLEEDEGKTLKYYKNTTNVDLITINGLNSTLTPTDVQSPETGQSPNTLAGVTIGTGDNDKVITISASALGKSDVKLSSKSGDYSLALDAADANAVSIKGADEAITYQTFKDGTLSIVQGKTEGWTRSSATLIKYTAPSTKVLAKITGLPKTLTFTETLADPTSNKIDGIELDSDGKTLKIDSRALAGITKDKATIKLENSNGGSYSFALVTDGDNKVDSPTAGKPELTLSGTTAYLKTTKTAGFTLNGNTITYAAKAQPDTIATIKGLPSGCVLKDGKIYLDDEVVLSYDGTEATNKQVTVNGSFITSYATKYNKAMTLSITGEGAFFNKLDGITAPGATSNNNATTFSKGTMTLKKTSSSGWATIAAAVSGGISSYQYKPAETSVVATVNGLNPDIVKFGNGSSGDGVNVDTNNRKITLGNAALNKKNVTVTMPNGTSKDVAYTFALDSNVNSTANSGTAANWENQVEWVASNGTATYKLYNKEHYNISETNTSKGTNSITYVAPNTTAGYATITGLTKVAGISAGDVSADGVVSLTADDLGTSPVKLSIAGANKVTVADSLSSVERSGLAGGKTNVGQAVSLASSFTLDLADGVNESKIQHAVWDTTGTTAKLVGTVTKGYVLSTDKKSVTYQAADQDGKEIAKITGLRSGAEVTANDVSPDTNDKRINYVKLDGYDLGTGNVAITGAGYKLALDSSKVILSSVEGASVTGGWKEQTDWTASNGTFTYKLYNKANWKVDENTGTSVKYTAAKDITNGTKLTITGLNTDVITQDVDRYISGAGASAIVDIKENMVVALGASALNRKTITLTDKSGDGYTLADISDNKSTVDATKLTGVVSGSKVTVRGTQSQGYLLSNDSQKLTYYAKATTQDVAVINGLTSTTYAASLKGSGAVNLSFDAQNNTFTLKDEQLSNSVTVSGSARFSFDADTKEKKIFGTSNSENIQVAGSGLTVNAGSGNDYIDLNSTSGNTVIYGGGNDVIANFGTSNTFKVTNLASGTNLVFLEDNNGDAILKVNSNKVRFKGLGNGADFSILDKNGAKVTHGSGGNVNVLADDNYSTTPQLSSIVNNSSGYMMTDDLTATDATSLTKQNTAIAYSGKK